MAFWKICKNGNIVRDKSGELVDRKDYNLILSENKKLKEELSLDNFDLKVCYLLQKIKLNSINEISATLYFNMGTTFVRNLLENQTNNDIQRNKFKEKDE